MSTPSDFRGSVEGPVLKATDHAVLGGLKMSGGAAIAVATTLTHHDSGNTFPVSQSAAYAITLPRVADMVGLRYRFVVTTAAANAVTIALAGATASFRGVILNNLAAAVMSGTTITIASGTAVVGDYIEVEGISSSVVHVRGATSATSGITIA